MKYFDLVGSSVFKEVMIYHGAFFLPVNQISRANASPWPAQHQRILCWEMDAAIKADWEEKGSGQELWEGPAGTGKREVANQLRKGEKTLINL